MKRWRIHFWNDDVMDFAYYEAISQPAALELFFSDYPGEQYLNIIEY